MLQNKGAAAMAAAAIDVSKPKLERFRGNDRETLFKFKLMAALQQRQTESSKDFLDRCKTAWYGLLRKLGTKYATGVEKAAHNDTQNECIKCMFICGMRNDIRMAVESIAGNTDSLETALAAAVRYESAMNIGGKKQGGAQKYGQVAAVEIIGSAAAAASSSSSATGAAGMKEMKNELAAISSALAAIGVQNKGGKPKPPGETGLNAICAGNGASTLRRNVQGRNRSVIISHLGRNCRHRGQQRTPCFTQTKQPAGHNHDLHRQGQGSPYQ
jgi:hypothetical protein